jgi:hypothetical protein
MIPFSISKAVRFNSVVAPFELFGSAVKPDFPPVRRLKYIKPFETMAMYFSITGMGLSSSFVV